MFKMQIKTFLMKPDRFLMRNQVHKDFSRVSSSV